MELLCVNKNQKFHPGQSIDLKVGNKYMSFEEIECQCGLSFIDVGFESNKEHVCSCGEVISDSFIPADSRCFVDIDNHGRLFSAARVPINSDLSETVTFFNQ